MGTPYHTYDSNSPPFGGPSIGFAGSIGNPFSIGGGDWVRSYGKLSFQQTKNPGFWNSLTSQLLHYGHENKVTPINAFNKIIFVGHFGPPGKRIMHTNGASSFENPTSGVHLSVSAFSAVNDGGGSGLFSDGVWTFGITGTVSAGMIGGSAEIGISLDFRNGFQLGGYVILEHAVGADLSAGFILNYHKPVSNSNNFGIPYLNGWGESYNGGLWILDGTYGGNSINPGLNPNNYSDDHSIFNTYSVGVSGGNPFGFTRNKGYTWTTPTFGW